MLPVVYTNTTNIRNFVYSKVAKSFNVFSQVRGIDLSQVEDDAFLFDFALITVDDDFAGDNDFIVTFTSTTEYRVQRSDGDVYRNLFIGTGDIGVDAVFTGVITIPEDTFSGTITIGDVVKFKVCRSISNNQLNAFMSEAETEIDSYARAIGTIPYSNFTTHVFGEVEALVPPDITLATTKWTVALMIQLGFLQISGTTDESANHEILKNSARKNVEQHGRSRSRTTPRLVSREDTDRTNGTTRKSLTEFSQSTTEFNNVDPTPEFISESPLTEDE